MLTIDTQEVKNAATKIGQCNDYLRAAKAQLNSISIPNDFVYKTTISGMPSKITTCIQTLRDEKNWANNQANKLENAESANRSILQAVLSAINLNIMTSNHFLQNIALSTTEMQMDLIRKAISESNEAFLNYFYQRFGYYGVNQGMFSDVFSILNNADGNEAQQEEFQRLLALLQQKYGMSEYDAARLMEYLDSIGACTYASAATKVIVQFADKPEEFEKYFGFPLYIVDSDGNVQINSGELLLDMYVVNNSDDLNMQANNLQKGPDGKITFKKGILQPSQTNPTETQFADQDYMNADQFNQYMKSKNIPVDVVPGESDRTFLPQTPDSSAFFQQVPKLLGTRLSLNPKEGEPLKMYIVVDNQTAQVELDETHSVLITGCGEASLPDGTTKKYIKVASWGGEYRIFCDDMDNLQSFTITGSFEDISNMAVG